MLLESPSGRQLFTLTPSDEAGVVDKMRFSADGTLLAVVHGAADQHGQVAASPGTFMRGSQVKIWDVKSGRELHSIAASELPNEAEFSADGRVIATTGSMGHLSLWDVQSGSKLRDLTSSALSTFTPPSIRPGQMPTMPNMADIAAMMNNVMGSMAAGTMGRTVTSMAFSPDGKILVSGGFESKTNIDFAAMMSGAMSGAKGGKRRKDSKTPDPQDLMKDLKVEAVGQVQIWDVATRPRDWNVERARSSCGESRV